MKKQYIHNSGYALPAVLILSTALLVMGTAILQNSLAIRAALIGQYYNSVAHEAASAGSTYANYCMGNGDRSWSHSTVVIPPAIPPASPLTPKTNCSGTVQTNQVTTVAVGSGWTSTFSVGDLDTRSDGATIVTSKGTVNANGGRQYNQTVKSTYTGASLQPILAAQVLSGSKSTFVLGANNNAYGYGLNDVGQLGNSATSAAQTTPVKFKLPAGITAQKVVSNIIETDTLAHVTYVIGSDNQVYGAGSNDVGQLGNSATSAAQTTPVKFILPAGLTATDVITDGDSTHVLASDRRIYGAGRNDSGQLGNGTTSLANVPHATPVKSTTSGLDAAAEKLIQGRGYWMLIATDYAVYGTGNNSSGQLGVGDQVNHPYITKSVLPAGVSAQTVVTSNTSGRYSTYVLGNNFRAYGAGDNVYYQLGDTTGTSGTHNSYGLLPLPAGVTSVDKIQAGATYSNFYMTGNDSQLYGIGSGSLGQLGNVASANYAVFQKLPFPAGAPAWINVRDFEVGYAGVHVLGADSQLYVSGYNSNGQMGNGTTTDIHGLVKVPMPAGVNSIANMSTPGISSQTFSFIGDDHKVYGAGYNAYGAVGNGNVTTQMNNVAALQPYGLIPSRVPQNIYGSVPSMFTLGNDFNIYGVGGNACGQLGIGNTVDQSTFQKFQLPAGLTVRKYSASRSSTNLNPCATAKITSCAIASDNNSYCAGVNNYGEVGNNQGASGRVESIPAKFDIASAGAPYVGIGTKEFVACGNYSVALGTDNYAWVSGDNANGQLGTGASYYPGGLTHPARVLLPAGIFAKRIGCGGNNNTWIIGSDNNLYYFGNDAYGSGGQGSISGARTMPIKYPLPGGRLVLDGTGVRYNDETRLAGSGANMFLIANDRTVWSSGLNTSGQDCRAADAAGSAADLTPFNVPIYGNTPRFIQSSYGTFFFVATVGTIASCGDNGNGGLGDGTTTNNNVLTGTVGGQLVRENFFFAGGQDMTFITTNNDVYSAGYNANGLLGDGTTTNRSTPVKFQLPAGVTASALSMDNINYSLYVIGSDGNVYSAGNNNVGQLGWGTIGTVNATPNAINLTIPYPLSIPFVF